MRFKFVQPIASRGANAAASQNSQSQPMSLSFTTLFLHKAFTSAKLLLISGALLAGAQLAQADVGSLYNDSCAACHDSGALNAIKKGDTARWNALIQQKGMDALVKSVRVGMIQMPAGGLCKSPTNPKENCSDKQYRELIQYMSK